MITFSRCISLKRNIKFQQKLQIWKNYSNGAEQLEKHRQQIMAKGLPKVKPITGVKNIFLIASGKGGVGKSTTAVNIATALKVIQPSKNVGLLDADVFGPTVPLMMNLNESPILNKDNSMEPLINYGVKCMSMGFLVSESSAVIWRGLMVMQALEKLLRQVHWGSIDYLIIDTPPGTGDTHLSLVQNIPISGVILVTTPQTAALNVTRRGAVMFQKLKVPLVGIIENMSYVKCPVCSNDVHIFGSGTERIAEEFKTPILERIPLNQKITECMDKGAPVVISDPSSKDAEAYKTVSNILVDFVNKMESES